MVTKLRAAGAYEVIQFGAAWKDADAYLKEHVMPYVSLPSFPTFIITLVRLDSAMHYNNEIRN
jgi:hypothetical protein